jgi:prefoldin subunit 5
MRREQEIEFLKAEAEALRRELKALEDRIGHLSAAKE